MTKNNELISFTKEDYTLTWTVCGKDGLEGNLTYNEHRFEDKPTWCYISLRVLPKKGVLQREVQVMTNPKSLSALVVEGEDEMIVESASPGDEIRASYTSWTISAIGKTLANYPRARTLWKYVLSQNSQARGKR